MGYLLAAYLIGATVIAAYSVWVTGAARRAKRRLLEEARRAAPERVGGHTDESPDVQEDGAADDPDLAARAER